MLDITQQEILELLSKVDGVIYTEDDLLDVVSETEEKKH